MEFMITRTSLWSDEKPCDEAYAKFYMEKEIRTFQSFEEYKQRFRKNFLDEGLNHKVNGDGYIEREFEVKGWFIEINSLKDLLDLQNKYGDIIIYDVWKNDEYKMIEIYDTYRE